MLSQQASDSTSPSLLLTLAPAPSFSFSPMVVKPPDPRKLSAVSTGTSPCRAVPTQGQTCSSRQTIPTPQSPHPQPPTHAPFQSPAPGTPTSLHTRQEAEGGERPASPESTANPQHIILLKY